jgi:rSAM/selenodomain-associated transferase 2
MKPSDAHGALPVAERPLRISIIIPALNEAAYIDATLQAVARLVGVDETIVIDGGSGDETVERARRHGVRVIRSAPGRGRQQHAGALAAQGDVLLFVHADSLPPEDATQQIRTALADPRVAGGSFRLRFAGTFASARLLTWIYRVLLPWLGLRYGDSGYFVRREVYQASGGFRPYPIFEDLDLKWRVKRFGRFVRLPGVMVTSSRRFEGRSFTLVFARWMLMQVLYWLGVSPHLIGRMYRHVRLPGESKPRGRSHGKVTGTADTQAR